MTHRLRILIFQYSQFLRVSLPILINEISTWTAGFDCNDMRLYLMVSKIKPLIQSVKAVDESRCNEVWIIV